MRNLSVYPITANEAIEVLKRAEDTQKILSRGQIGGIDGLTLLIIEKFIEQNKERFDTFSKASLQVIFEDKNE